MPRLLASAARARRSGSPSSLRQTGGVEQRLAVGAVAGLALGLALGDDEVAALGSSRLGIRRRR